MHTEIENKFEVDATDFKHLTSNFKIESFRECYTVYYDNDLYLNKINATFRVRLVEDKKLMCFKLKESQNNGLRKATEIEEEIDYMPGNEILSENLPDDFKNALTKENIHRLNKLGSMYIYRYKINFFDKYLVELDKVVLPDLSIFYEVEFEEEDLEKQSDFEKLLTENYESARPSCLNKYQRFVGALSRRIY